VADWTDCRCARLVWSGPAVRIARTTPHRYVRENHVDRRSRSRSEAPFQSCSQIDYAAERSASRTSSATTSPGVLPRA
jgi:hypothetical protein